MAKYIDMHHHLVYGVDDGPKTLKKSQRMIDAAYRDGVRIIIATSHVYPGRKRFDQALYRARLNELNAYCKACNYDMIILSGAEVYYTDATVRLLGENRVPTMNDGDFILLECSTRRKISEFEHAIREICNAGYIPIVAHIERYPNLWFKLKAIEQLVETFDMRIQVDAEAFLDKLPFWGRRFLKGLVKRDLIDYVASDAHNVTDRRVCMNRVYKVLAAEYGKKYARKLTGGNQRELIDRDRV